jgi:hypothetical protein
LRTKATEFSFSPIFWCKFVFSERRSQLKIWWTLTAAAIPWDQRNCQCNSTIKFKEIMNERRANKVWCEQENIMVIISRGMILSVKANLSIVSPCSLRPHSSLLQNKSASLKCLLFQISYLNFLTKLSYYTQELMEQRLLFFIDISLCIVTSVLCWVIRAASQQLTSFLCSQRKPILTDGYHSLSIERWVYLRPLSHLICLRLFQSEFYSDNSLVTLFSPSKIEALFGI